MNPLDIKRIAHNILENQSIESSFIEYKKSTNFKDKMVQSLFLWDKMKDCLAR